MPSCWIARRPRKSGGVSYRVMFRVGGRESAPRYGGAFSTMREAKIRRDWLAGELASMRLPDLRLLVDSPQSPTVTEAARKWRDSRVDVADATRVLHRVALSRVTSIIGTRRVDELTPSDVAELVATLSAAGYKRETISKSLTALAQTLDYAGIEPNPARDKRHVKLPREEREEPNPPTADHVEAVCRLLPSKHRLAFLFLDWSGARVAAVDLTRVSDYDEPRRRVRLRASTTKTRKALWIDLHPVLAEALETALGPREDRDPQARLFASSGADALRTSIGKACRAAGVPTFSPHDLRHRRVSLLHEQGRSWAEIGALVGQRNLAVTANTYTHVLIDGRELDYAAVLGGYRSPNAVRCTTL